MHLDGSIRAYSKDRLEKRIATTLSEDIRPDHKIKMFRMDGKISTEDWAYLTATFFRKNEMIFEYFDPIGFKDKYTNSPISYLEWIDKQRRIGGNYDS